MALIRSEDGIYNDEDRINELALTGLLKEHEKEVVRYKKLEDYYNGNQNILIRKREDVNNRLVINHAEYITDFSTAYFMGNPIKYRFPNEETKASDDRLIKAFKIANIDQVDTELSRDISKFGVGYELIYQDRNGNTRSVNSSPLNTFIVVDDTVEENKLLGVQYYPSYDDNGNEKYKVVNIYTNTGKVFRYNMKNAILEYDSEDSHAFKDVPIIEYWNKSNVKGDYESVIPIIDAYNKLQSDRINDKEQFVDALLAIYGMLTGDDSDEKLETARELKRVGIIELGKDNKAEFITKTFQEADVEILKQSLVNDIHKISKVPNLTDENFAGNSSGVAMKYKLLGLEQLAQTKEGYYRIGIKERLRLYKNILNIQNIDIDVDEVEISFTRSLPVNEIEISQLIANLENKVSNETLISQLPFVEDVKTEIERVKEQRKNSINSFQDTFGGYEQINE